MSYLALTGIQKRFAGGTVAVQDFNLEAQRGEFVSFLGPSGCGKTTTLRMIAGFEKPTAGRISIDGRDVTDLAPNRRNVGMVFQNYALFPNMTVAGNIAFGLNVRKRPKDQTKKRVAELLELINLADKGGRYPYQLSGGQQQRIALARALAFEPTVLLLDEPLSALDAKIRVALRIEIRAIQRQLGITTVYVTHDQEEALSLSDRVVVMSEGHVEQVGAPFEIYNFPATPFVASFVGTLSLLPGTIVDPANGVVRVAGQQVRVAKHLTGGAGRNLTVALRPEMGSLGASTDPADNNVQGTVTDVAFLGSIVRIRVSLAEGGPIVALDEFNEPTLKLPAVGETTTIHFPADGPLVIDTGAPVEQLEELIAEA
ncbi:MAG TPA: ABC transporter ATP-binding protein [Candidatus Limnocylindrales bacterium]|nr:ABC transporter ATP-binding protein [Candidatus Limnocylindrales bacterium]